MTSSNPSFDAFVQAAIDAGSASKKKSNGAGRQGSRAVALVRADLKDHPDSEWGASCARVIGQLEVAQSPEVSALLESQGPFEELAVAIVRHKQSWSRVKRETEKGAGQ